MNRLAEMEVFVAIVDAGSISAAADRLDIAKSAASKRLSDLEQRLGVSLMQRTTRRLSLTGAGSEFYQRCAAILNELADAEADITAATAALSGEIRIAAPLSFGLLHLSPAINAFTSEHPNVQINIDFNDRLADLVEEGFDLGIRIARLDDSSLVARKLAPIRQLVCASPEYWHRAGRPRQPQDLKQHTALRYTLSAQRNWTWTSENGKRGSVTVPTTHAANNGSFLADIAAAGAGVVRMPAFIVHQHIEAGTLEPVLTQYNWNDLTAWAVYPQTRHLPHRTRALIDHLASSYGPAPYWEDCLR